MSHDRKGSRTLSEMGYQRGDDLVVESLAELWSAMIELLESVVDDDWARPTPCSEWDVRELTAHVAGGQGIFEGLPQPAPPPGWSTDHAGVHALTAAMVAARHDWRPPQVLDELRRATTVQLARLRSLDDEGWSRSSEGPPGIKTVRDLARNRLLDGYIHLLDLRVALDRPLDLEAEPRAFVECVAQARDFAGWGAVKKAGLTDGSRVRIDLGGRAGFTKDLVVEERRGSLVDPDPSTTDRIEGTAAAFLMGATGRPQWRARAGGIKADGPVARRFLEGYVIWA
jgi:uncharacterized protein (TIGR03083 family)